MAISAGLAEVGSSGGNSLIEVGQNAAQRTGAGF
jgi:hypothetical protein